MVGNEEAGALSSGRSIAYTAPEGNRYDLQDSQKDQYSNSILQTYFIHFPLTVSSHVLPGRYPGPMKQMKVTLCQQCPVRILH